ncbi:MAG: ATP-binding protein [Bacteroidota bacterium]
MGLEAAHEGYEYQDLLTAHFILDEILNERDGIFKIDRKEFGGDRVDDLTITNSLGSFKKQIKYSSDSSNHRLEKPDLSTDGSYHLAIDTLFNTWYQHPAKESLHLSLCLSWLKPTDELDDLLIKDEESQDIGTTFKLDAEKLWPKNQLPLSSWKRFRQYSQDIKRTDFLKFCESFSIGLEYPKFSMNLNEPGSLERTVLDQTKSLGIGVYPNDGISNVEFTYSLLQLIKRTRSGAGTITSKDILSQLKIRTDYGSIEQEFPIILSENIRLSKSIGRFIKEITNINLIALVGEPGSGKSWFIENLRNQISKSGAKVVRHFCYTDLQDTLQKERITLNALYGNLIKDILDEFPDLSEFKAQKYASNLSELNILLSNIKEPTYIIIDGLDHIKRVFNFRSYPDLTLTDIDIIKTISKLVRSENVKVIIGSQPIEELDSIQGLTKVQVPKWTINETKKLLGKSGVENFDLESGISLASALQEKSAGNPLYLKYLIQEVKEKGNFSVNDLNKIPAYSSNLKEYYSFLLDKLGTMLQVPRILSGLNFSVSKHELQEITGEGQQVDISLKLIAPVLKHNLTQSGYSIYHESFRRFIIDTLQEEQVSLDKVVFNPILAWFEEKGFFEFQKSYRFYLQFLIESGRPEAVLEHLQHNFVAESIANGHSWEAIKKNYQFLKLAVEVLENFPKIIILNQLAKTIVSTSDSLDWVFESYLNALGYLKGFDFVTNYLSFEGRPSMSLKNGLQACYLCSQNNIGAPWNLYIDYFPKGANIELEDFHLYVRHHLANENDKAILEICDQLSDKSNLDDYRRVFLREIDSLSNQFTKSISQRKCIRKLRKHDTLNIGIEELSTSLTKLEHEHIYDTEVEVLENFLDALSESTDRSILNKISNQFKGRNWFFNWLIYQIKIRQFKLNKNNDSYELIESFEYLIFDLDPFKGRPKASGLYHIRDLIYDSISNGLELVKSEKNWKQILEILTKLTNGTTVSLKKELAGPLATHEFFRLLDENTPNAWVKSVIAIFESEIKDNETFQLHWYISDYYFRLSRLYSLAEDVELAENSFRKGVEYALGYTHRKDPTMEDPLACVESAAKQDLENASNYIQRLKPLVDSAVEHTEKGTRHFPIDWFESYCNINFSEAAIYLLNQLKHTRYNWVFESCIESILKKALGEVNPNVELWLSRTLPIENNTAHIDSILTIIEETHTVNKQLAIDSFNSVYIKAQLETNGYSKEIIERMEIISRALGLDNLIDVRKVKIKEDYKSRETPIDRLISSTKSRKSFSDMSFIEVRSFFEENDLTDKEVNSLIYFFEESNFDSDELHELIAVLIEKNARYYKEDDQVDLSILFKGYKQVEASYWLSKFIHQHGGWYEELVNINAFKKAFLIDKEFVLKKLIPWLSPQLGLHFNKTISANLINALSAIGHEKRVILEMWENLIKAIDYRLPQKERIDWKEELRNDLSLNDEEVLICILFCRFKNATTERYVISLTAIANLLYQSPELMIKPLKWFLTNHKLFLSSVQLSILELLREYGRKNELYINHFKSELQKVYPSSNYLIDATIESLLQIFPTKVVFRETSLHYPITNTDYQTLLNINPRHRRIEMSGLDLENTFGKIHSTIQSENREKLDLYWNRSYEWMVKNLLGPDYILKTIGTELYEDFRKFDNQETVLNDLTIDIKNLVAQTVSRKLRPLDLKRPDELTSRYKTKTEFEDLDGWIRIGHFENQLVKKNHLKLKPLISYGGLVYAEDPSKDHPFFKYPIETNHFWRDPYQFEINEYPVAFRETNHDGLEDYNLLWLNQSLANKLKIRPSYFIDGFIGKNPQQEIVLKCNFWKEDYVGEGMITGIKDEIPKLEGVQLFIRKDYFDKLNQYFGSKPSYCIHLVGR